MAHISSRVLALGTVASVAGLGIASGVFGTFSSTLITGQTCTGYGYVAGYGYGYDCVATVVPSTPTSGGGGGGGSSSSAIATTATPNTVPTVVPPSAIIAKDITKSVYRSAIEILISRGIMNNVGVINPNRAITRAEFLKLLALANGYKQVPAGKNFADLPKTHSLYNYVQFGVSKGWVNAKNTNFRPNDVIAQGEIDKLIAAIKGTATADTVVQPSAGVTRGKAAYDIVQAFFN